MGFNSEERPALLALKGVGLTVLQRCEEIGIHSLQDLKQFTVTEIAILVASMLRTNCWKNSRQAKAAIGSAIELAKHYTITKQMAGGLYKANGRWPEPRT